MSPHKSGGWERVHATGNWDNLGKVKIWDLHVAVLSDEVDSLARVWLKIGLGMSIRCCRGDRPVALAVGNDLDFGTWTVEPESNDSQTIWEVNRGGE